MAKVLESDYCGEQEAARLMGLDVDRFRERLRWGRGPVPVGKGRQGEPLWVKAMCRATAEARRQGHVV